MHYRVQLGTCNSCVNIQLICSTVLVKGNVAADVFSRISEIELSDFDCIKVLDTDQQANVELQSLLVTNCLVL